MKRTNKLLITTLFICSFMTSTVNAYTITTLKNGSNLSNSVQASIPKYSDNQVIKVAKQCLSTLYSDEKLKQKTNFKINTTVENVYDLFDELVGYMVTISNDDNQDIGTMYLTELNGELVLNESTISQNVVKKHKEESNKSDSNIGINNSISKSNSKSAKHKLVRVAPLQYASKSEITINNVLNDETYYDLSRGKDATSEVKKLKKYQKDKADKLGTNSQNQKSSLNNIVASTSVTTSLTSLSTSSTFTGGQGLKNDFGTIVNGSYGGDQGWFASVYPKGTTGDNENSVGCGPVAAANIAAYYAKYYPSLSKLYGSTYDRNNYCFTLHQQSMFSDGLGIPQILPMFTDMMKLFASQRNIVLDTHSVSAYGWYFSPDFEALCQNIKTGIAHNAPVALLLGTGSEVYDPTLGESVLYAGNLGNIDCFTTHWVTITNYSFVSNSSALVAVSSWGGLYILNLPACMDKRTFLDTTWFTQGSYSASDPIKIVVAPVWPVIQNGSSGANVVGLQWLLRYRGYNIAVDGACGPNTVNAIKSWQSAVHLTINGIADGNTIGSAITQISYGNTNTAVNALQYLLNSKFGCSLSVDGDFGSATYTAVKGFQSAHGLTDNGIVDYTTWVYLFGLN